MWNCLNELGKKRLQYALGIQLDEPQADKVVRAQQKQPFGRFSPDSNKGRVAVRETAHHTGAAADLPV